MHPNAHLWDNGNDPVELKKCHESSVKSVIAIWTEQHTQEHTNGNARRCIRSHLFISYQIEAVSKVVGGLYYSYAVKETDK
jgi:hypothetical protein